MDFILLIWIDHKYQIIRNYTVKIIVGHSIAQKQWSKVVCVLFVGIKKLDIRLFFLCAYIDISCQPMVSCDEYTLQHVGSSSLKVSYVEKHNQIGRVHI